MVAHEGECGVAPMPESPGQRKGSDGGSGAKTPPIINWKACPTSQSDALFIVTGIYFRPVDLLRDFIGHLWAASCLTERVN